MWSSNRHDERLLDIACRRSTPNSLDDPAGQELGEVNLLLEQRFSQPVPPPDNLTWDAVTRLIMTAPAPEPPIPWWRIALQPGQLAAACAIAGLAVAAFVSLPIYRTQVPAIEGTVYARGNDSALSLPPPSAVLPDDLSSKHGTITFKKQITFGSDDEGRHQINIDLEKHVTSPIPLSTDATEVTPQQLHQEIRAYGTMVQTDDISGASLMEKVREMNTKVDGDWEFSVSPKQITIEQRVSMLEAIKQHYGGEGFLPETGGSTEDQQVIVLTDADLQSMSPEELEQLGLADLDKLMQLEMARSEDAEADAEGSSAPRTTGRQP